MTPLNSSRHCACHPNAYRLPHNDTFLSKPYNAAETGSITHSSEDEHHRIYEQVLASSEPSASGARAGATTPLATARCTAWSTNRLISRADKELALRPLQSITSHSHRR
jgi:hypothetical protein